MSRQDSNRKIDKHRINKELSGLPQVFILQRDVDFSNVSGTGIVAWGVEFPDGVCVLRWTSKWPTSVVFHDKGMESIKAVHGHGGKTRVVYIDHINPNLKDDLMDFDKAEVYNDALENIYKLARNRRGHIWHQVRKLATDALDYVPDELYRKEPDGV